MTRTQLTSALTATFLVPALLAGCGGEEALGREGNPPGASAEAGDVAVRYVHLEDPPDADAYLEGSDVPLYAWFRNEGEEPVQLMEVSSELADDVALTQGSLPLELPVGELVELGPDDVHLVLEDISRGIRAQDLVPVEMTFSNGATVEVEVEAIEVDPADVDF